MDAEDLSSLCGKWRDSLIVLGRKGLGQKRAAGHICGLCPYSDTMIGQCVRLIDISRHLVSWILFQGCHLHLVWLADFGGILPPAWSSVGKIHDYQLD